MTDALVVHESASAQSGVDETTPAQSLAASQDPAANSASGPAPTGSVPPGSATPGSGQPVQNPYGQPAAQAPLAPRNVFAIIALVLGLVGFNILAVVFGFIGLSQIKRTGERGRGMAIAGVILGFSWVIGLLLFFMIAQLVSVVSTVF